MEIKTLQKVSRSGDSLIVNIPKKIIQIKKIELGDYIEINWGEVIKKETIKEKKEIILPKI